MRPLTLTIDGLRSYRRPATLDFSGVNLLAIVGDTGAGKSSILEAITYALYSAATWTGQPGELIADGARTMKVALTFKADGKRWQVTRSMSRDGYPAPVHRLVCDDDGVVINGRSDVNAAIERLVGLDCKAFLQSVILPQGRFAELLKATPGERGKILQNIFRVDELLAARDTADRLVSRWGPRQDALVTTRSLYLDDPTTAAEDAAARRTAAESRKQALDDLRRTITQLQVTATEADRDAAELDELANGLADPGLKGTAAELSELATLSAELSASRGALDEARQAARRREKDALDQLEQAAREGVGLTDLVKAEAELEALARELGDVAEATNQAITDTAELEAVRQRATQQQADAEAAAGRAAEAQAQVADATDAAADAIRARDTARDALAVYRNKAEQERSVADDLRQCCEDLEAHRTTAERLAAEALDASSKAEAAEQRLREIERSAAAAAASHDCNAGDPCPVCDRELPTSWRPPTAPKPDTVRHQRDQLARARDTARTDADTAAGLQTAAVARENERRAALARAWRTSSQALTHLAEVTLLTMTQLKAKIADDGAVLAKVETAAAKAETKRDQLIAFAADQRDAATRASAEANAASKDVSDRERSLRSSTDKLTKTCAGLRNRAAKLPETIRPEVAREGTLDLGLAPEERTVTLGASRVADALQVVWANLATLRDVEAAGTAARADRERLDEQLEAQQARWTSEVAEPTAAAARRADKLANRLTDVLTRLEQPAAPQRPSANDAAEVSQWAAAIEKAADTTIKALAKRAKTQRDQATKARRQVADCVAKSGITEVDALDAATVDAATDAQIAAAEERTARAQIPLVAQLDDRITRGGAFLADLRAVHDLLGNSRYIAYVMRRRQQALLGVATNLLGDMSAGRFGFSEDFQVVDCHSGQPRSTSTLSGGESFQASMALALAMVELAGRAGGRLDSLFLDEGFASLGANALDIAIDTLEGRAKAGRLVAVISHVKTLAERIDNVLAVTYNPSDGSSFRMLTPAERTGLVQDDATAAVAGLLS
jgi:DNA repair protein SbcC/Rad50